MTNVKCCPIGCSFFQAPENSIGIAAVYSADVSWDMPIEATFLPYMVGWFHPVQTVGLEDKNSACATLPHATAIHCHENKQVITQYSNLKLWA